MKKAGLPVRGKRGDRLIRERVHDPYKTRLKLTEPTACPQCGAIFHKGRWTWDERPPEAKEELCQACHRINDKYPAGVLTLSGAFVRGHRREILNLARNTEAVEKAEHPLHRIMAIEQRDDEIDVTATDIHLPRRIGQALHDAYEGDLDFRYDAEGYFIRVHWRREA
jgi:hypothetical protein